MNRRSLNPMREHARVYPLSLFVVAALLVATAVSISTAIGLALALLLAVIMFVFIAANRPYWIVLALVVYLPFETFLPSILPVPDLLNVVMQFGSEALIYLTCGIVVSKRLLLTGTLRKTPLDWLVGGFLLIVVLSILVNGPPLIGSLLNVRSLLRYVFLFYLVINIDMSKVEVRRLLYVILWVGILQLVLGLFQLATGATYRSWFLPRAASLEALGQERGFRLLITGREIGSILGTLGDTLYFGLFLLVVLSIYLGRLSNSRRGIWSVPAVAIIAVLFVSITYSYARGAMLAFLAVLAIYYWLRYGRGKVLLSLMSVLPLLIVLVITLFLVNESGAYVNPTRVEKSALENFTSVFSRSYVEVAQRNRLGSVLLVPPIVLSERPILGYGPDETTTVDTIARRYPDIYRGGFEDVYWVALLAYYGIPGVLLMAMLFLRILQSAIRRIRSTSDQLIRHISTTTAILVAATPLLMFFYRVLEFRAYSFYLWLFVGLMYSVSSRGKEKVNM